MSDKYQPSVTVVVPTHDRPELLLKTLRAIVGQDYPGTIGILVVFDRNQPTQQLSESISELGATWCANSRDPGLAGARNTGILAASTELVAFCDDDDRWAPAKLRAQIELLAQEPSAGLVTCGINVIFGDKSHPRVLPDRWIYHEQFLASRLAMVHSSTLLFRRDFLLGIGMVDEQAPEGQNEDWDLLLRASARGPILNLPVPLVDVLWGRTSFFSHAYESKIRGLEWMLVQHPDLVSDKRAHSRVLGQISFWQASMDDRAARDTARAALKLSPRQWRAVLALAVGRGLVSSDRVLRTLHRVGRGV